MCLSHTSLFLQLFIFSVFCIFWAWGFSQFSSHAEWRELENHHCVLTHHSPQSVFTAYSHKTPSGRHVISVVSPAFSTQITIWCFYLFIYFSSSHHLSVWRERSACHAQDRFSISSKSSAAVCLTLKVIRHWVKKKQTEKSRYEDGILYISFFLWLIYFQFWKLILRRNLKPRISFNHRFIPNKWHDGVWFTKLPDQIQQN